MAWFVVTIFNGTNPHFAVELDSLCNPNNRPNGEHRWPIPFEVIEISNESAAMPMDHLIRGYAVYRKHKMLHSIPSLQTTIGVAPEKVPDPFLNAFLKQTGAPP